MSPVVNLDDGLTLVIPVFNEAEHVSKTISCAINALSIAEVRHQIIVVDDGSTDETREELNTLKNIPNLETHLNEHKGRIATRLHGVKAAKFNNVLMVDARIRLDENAILNLKRLCKENPAAQFWNGHLVMMDRELPFVSIWETLVAFGWGSYARNPSLVHFGLEEFDRFPKGTGIFLAPRQSWEVGLTSLVELEESSSSAISDDTRLLREFASESDIWISPEFTCSYKPRTSLLAFLKNLTYRGTTFVDSYWDSGSFVGKVLRGGIPVSVVMLLISFFVFEFRTLLQLIMFTLCLLSIAIGICSFVLWRAPLRAVRETLVGFLFWPVFGLGVIRGSVAKLARKANA